MIRQSEPLEDRCIKFGEYILERKATVRSTAKNFGISKSTVHKDVTERLYKINHNLYTEVKKVLDQNKKERHIRGGMATREKYLHLHQLQKEQRTAEQSIPPITYQQAETHHMLSPSAPPLHERQ